MPKFGARCKHDESQQRSAHHVNRSLSGVCRAEAGVWRKMDVSWERPGGPLSPRRLPSPPPVPADGTNLSWSIARPLNYWWRFALLRLTTRVTRPLLLVVVDAPQRRWSVGRLALKPCHVSSYALGSCVPVSLEAIGPISLAAKALCCVSPNQAQSTWHAVVVGCVLPITLTQIETCSQAWRRRDCTLDDHERFFFLNYVTWIRQWVVVFRFS